MSFVHKQETFEGPLDLLLHLIEQEKLDITEVSLARVTDQFLGYVQDLERRQLPEVTDFLVIAARLLVLKSRALLPTDEGEEPAEDDLAERLREYRRIKELSRQIGSGLAANHFSLAKPPAALALSAEFTPEGIELTMLHQAFGRLVTDLPVARPAKTEVLDEQITIEECIDQVRQHLDHGPTKFEKLFAGLRSRLAMIITFLAILELFKQRLLAVNRDQASLTLSLRA